MKEELERFIIWVNGEHTPLGYDDTASFYRTAIEESFARQFTDKGDDQERNDLRVSSIGKPCVLQALKLLGYSEPAPERKMRFVFHLGDIFEAYITLLAKAYGFNVITPQAEVNFNGVLGHIDFILQSPTTGEMAVIELKTMSGSYWNKFHTSYRGEYFAKEDPTCDTRGYIAQAAIYSHCIGLPIYWIVMDKSRNLTHLVQPVQENLDAAIYKAEKIIPKLRQVQQFNDVLTLFKAPPGIPEFSGRGRNKEATGNYTLVESMQYSPFRHVFYDLVLANKWNEQIEYIVDYRSPEEAKEVLEELTNDI